MCAEVMCLHMAGTVVTVRARRWLVVGVRFLSHDRYMPLRVDMEGAEMLVDLVDRFEAHDSFSSGMVWRGVVDRLLGFGLHDGRMREFRFRFSKSALNVYRAIVGEA